MNKFLLRDFFLAIDLKISDISKILWSGKYIFIISFLLLASAQFLFIKDTKLLKLNYIYYDNTDKEFKPNSKNINVYKIFVKNVLKEYGATTDYSVKWIDKYTSFYEINENDEFKLLNKKFLSIEITNIKFNNFDKDILKIEKNLNKLLNSYQLSHENKMKSQQKIDLVNIKKIKKFDNLYKSKFAGQLLAEFITISNRLKSYPKTQAKFNFVNMEHKKIYVKNLFGIGLLSLLLTFFITILRNKKLIFSK